MLGMKNDRGKKEYVPYEKTVTITEVRPTTDESLRLLSEMQEKARLSIIKSVLIETNYVKCIANYYKDETVERRVLFALRFILNDKEHVVNGHYDYTELEMVAAKCDQYVYDLFFKKFSEAIASELIKQDIQFIKKLTNM